MLLYTYIAYLVYDSSSLYSVLCLGNSEKIIAKDMKHRAIFLDTVRKNKKLDILRTMYHLVIYMQSNKIHKVIFNE